MNKSSIKREIEAALRNEPIIPPEEPSFDPALRNLFTSPTTWIVLLYASVSNTVAIALYLRFRKRGA